jgi:NAD(P)-dependent dehydrogenase (short-subunit alcohol dehydrogenase family)
LGRATVDRLIREGAKGVIAFDIKFNDKFNANNVVAINGSVVSEEDVTKALEKCHKEFGRLDAVFNCADIHTFEILFIENYFLIKFWICCEKSFSISYLNEILFD